MCEIFETLCFRYRARKWLCIPTATTAAATTVATTAATTTTAATATVATTTVATSYAVLQPSARDVLPALFFIIVLHTYVLQWTHLTSGSRHTAGLY